MESDIYSYLSSEDGLYVHIGVITALLLGGFGLPIPEDIPLILAGIAASKKIVSPQAIFATCYLGVIVADQLIYLIGYIFGKQLIDAAQKSSFFPAVTESRINKIHKGLREKRLLYIFMGRHLFPLRSATFLTAGALRIPFFEFLASDMLAAFVSVILMLGLGYVLGEALSPEVVQEFTNRLHLVIIAVCLVFGLVLYCKHKRKTSNTNPE